MRSWFARSFNSLYFFDLSSILRHIHVQNCCNAPRFGWDFGFVPGGVCEDGVKFPGCREGLWFGEWTLLLCMVKGWSK